jgi:hypothetical protein
LFCRSYYEYSLALNVVIKRFFKTAITGRVGQFVSSSGTF